MINGNRLKFGYGDICVKSNGLTQRMSFQQFKPLGKCGDRVSEDMEYIREEIILQFCYRERAIRIFSSCLAAVSAKSI